ncbi:MAG: hypothetical protein ACLQF0_14755 [Dissulfurispiraceae bacterium]
MIRKSLIKIAAVISLALMVLPGYYSGSALCADKNQVSHPAAQPLQFNRNQDISQIKPRKPVRIKLHRSAKGEYQWDITGDNADDIVRADRRLRKLLETE